MSTIHYPEKLSETAASQPLTKRAAELLAALLARTGSVPAGDETPLVRAARPAAAMLRLDNFSGMDGLQDAVAEINRLYIQLLREQTEQQTAAEHLSARTAEILERRAGEAGENFTSGNAPALNGISGLSFGGITSPEFGPESA